MRFAALVFAGVLLPGVAFADCTGDLKGYFEKQPLSGGAFEAVQTFTINSDTGMIEQCERDNAFDGNFAQDGDRMQFGYARRMRELTRGADGDFVTGSWQAEFDGVTSVYRIRVAAE